MQMPYGTAIEQTSAASVKVESWLRQQPEARIVTAYVGQGAPRFYLAMAPELPDPSFAKIVVLTPNEAGARGAQAPTATGGGQWLGARGPRASDAAGVRPVFAVSGGIPRDGARPRHAS